ncbi:hypothetical protein BIY27_25800 [Gibbsiella quercinecans]|uniref:hypothetical protein n=1 Tax=Gibbsiella quercinecans TaxID=929813 RepID=UPI000EF1B322|nr:hypothetical protein [Gibbsiella quercinecans]RLM02112.1 hypothetical protein BIY27_25800 [Gibbsiella quercinecans]
MGLWSYLTGGNVKVVAGSIAHAHRRYRGDYQAVYNEFISRINADTDWGGPQKNLEVNTGIVEVKNYTDLGGLYLYAEAAPNPDLLDDIRERFASELSRHLQNKGIPEDFISGVNI